MGGVAIFPGIQYPKIDTPIEVATKQATLGDILAQKQQRQQTVQDNAIKLQKAQQEQLDEQNFTNHVRATRLKGGTIDDALNTAVDNGVSAGAVQKYRDLDGQIKDRYATADRTRLANELAQNDMVSADLLPIRTMQDPGMKAAQWAKAVQNAQAKGFIKPNDPSIPATYPGDQAYEAAMAHLQGAKDYITYGINSQKAADEHVTALHNQKMYPSQESEAATKAAAEQTKAAGTELAAADSQSVWTRILAKYPGAGQQLGEVYSETAAKRAGEFTITPEQRNVAAATQLNRDQLEEARKERIAKLTDNELYMKATDPTDPDSAHARRALDLKETERLAGTRGGAGGSKSIQPYITNEGKLNRMRSALGTAISSGKVYVDRLGGMKPIATLGDEEAQQAGIEEMKNRFHDVTGELMGVIEEKNNAIVKAGGTPSVSTEQAKAALDEGTYKLMPPGLITRGNIDLKNRPVVKNPDGTTSTVKTITVEMDGHTVLLPTVVSGKIVSNEEAIKHYQKTGEHMGIFATEKDADEYDKRLHNQMGWNGAPGSGQAAWQASAGKPPAPQAPQKRIKATMPDGTVQVFPSQKAFDDFSKKYGLTSK